MSQNWVNNDQNALFGTNRHNLNPKLFNLRLILEKQTKCAQEINEIGRGCIFPCLITLKFKILKLKHYSILNFQISIVDFFWFSD
jgi:hypothetical protein